MKRLKVSSVNAATGDLKGEIDLNWDSLDEAETYIIQYCCNNNNSWKLADVIQESKYTITGLKSDKTYYFRVASINKSKQGPWSEPVKKRVP